MMHDPIAVYAAVYAALHAAHTVADHWVQTQDQADSKGQPGRPGRRACLAHVTTYGLTQLVSLVALVAVLGLPLSGVGLAVGMAVNLASHYVADRRTPLRRLAELTGSDRFWRLGTPRPGRDDLPTLGTGAYALDQAWHVGWLAVTALIVAAA